MEEDNSNNMNNKITSTHIFQFVGSAIIGHALALLELNEDEMLIEGVVVAAKKDQAKEKKATNTTALVTTYSEILKRL